MRKIYFFIALLLQIAITNAQTIISAQTGNWNDGSTWVGGVVPGSANDVVIDAGHTVSYTSGSFANINIVNLTINATATLAISGGRRIIANGNIINAGTAQLIAGAGTLRAMLNFTIQSTGQITGGGAISVQGSSFINEGSIDVASLACGTINGGTTTVAQTISGAGSFDINRISIDNSNASGVSLETPLVVGDVLLGGKLFLGNYDLTVTTGGLGSGTTAAYIVTNGTGRVIYATANSTKTFPVGTSTSFTPITISGGNVTTHTFAVNVSNMITGSPGSAIVNRQWNIEDITGGANADIQFQWNGSDESGTFNRALSAVAHYDGSNWQPVTSYGAASGSNPYTRTATGVTSFSPFIVGSSGSFPISSVQSGNWNAASTWTGGIVPSSTDNVIISSGHTVTYDVINASINSLSVNSSATLQLGADNILTVSATVSNAGAIRLGTNSNLRVGGDFSNSSSLQPVAGATNTLLSVGGNIINSGSITGESLYFSATNLGLNTTAQSVTGSNGLFFNNVVLMNDGVPVTFNAQFTFETLSFGGNSGNLILQNVALIITNTITGTNASKYIQTNGTSFVRIIGSASPKFFPVGTNTSYTPLTISNGNIATHNFTVRVSNTFTNAPFNNAVVNREWNITDNTGGANVDLSFQWNGSDEDPSFNRASSYVGHYNGTMWVPVSPPSAASGSDPYTKTVTGATSFSPFGVGSSGALPVHLINFNVVKNGSHVKLEWIVENEINFSHYEIERSTDGRNYSQIRMVASANNGSRNEYTFTDAIASGISYYRLRMVDIDGSFSYSKVVKIDFGKKYTVSVYPNPATDRIYIQNMSKYNRAQIIDVTGRIIGQVFILPGDEYLTIQHLKSGSYYLKLIAKDDAQTIQFIKQ